jgi:hypothetical protein
MRILGRKPDGVRTVEAADRSLPDAEYERTIAYRREREDKDWEVRIHIKEMPAEVRT